MRTPLWIFVSLLALPASATNSFAQGVEFGIKGGLVNGTVVTSGPNALTTKADQGWALGGFGAVAITGRLLLQPEFFVAKRRFLGVENRVEAAIESRSIEIPILVRVRSTTSARIKPSLYGGPQFNFISSVDQILGGQKSDLSERIKDFDPGIVFGAGLDISAGRRGAVVLDARFNIGQRNLTIEANGPKSKARAFLALAGYRF